jgi:RNA polymerase sigma-70 factor (ECF subfamily)
MHRSKSAVAIREFEEFFRVAWPKLLPRVVATSGGIAPGEDALQEAFSRAWRDWDKIRSLDRPDQWVARIATNIAISRWRKVRREVFGILAPSPVLELPEPAADLVRVLSRLPASQRTAVLLRYYADLSTGDIAAEMNVPEGTVKSWLSRGRLRLAAELGSNSRDSPSKGGIPHADRVDRTSRPDR